MRRTFSIVIDIQLDTESIQTKEQEVFNAVVSIDDMKLIQNTLEHAIKVRNPLPDDISVEIWDSKKIIEQIETLSTIQTNSEESNQYGSTCISSIEENIPVETNNDLLNPLQYDIHDPQATLLQSLIPLESLPNKNQLKPLQNEKIFTGSHETLRCLTKHEAQKMRVFPIRSENNSIIFATITQDSALVNKLRLITGKKIVCIESPLQVILNSIEKAYTTSVDSADREALLSSLTNTK